MINLGLRAHDLGKLTVSELASKVSEYPVTGIQLALKKAIKDIDFNNQSLSPGFGNFCRDMFKKKDINISVLGCYINPVHPDLEIREKQQSFFIEHLKYAHSFGCSIVGTETGSNLPDCGFTKDIYLEETFQDFIKSLKILVKNAESFGVIVGIEAVADKHTIHSHERLKRVLDLIPSPNLGVIYDPVNLISKNDYNDSDTLMKDAFKEFSSRFVAIHAKDFIIENGCVNGSLPSGKGNLNYELFFDLIKFYKPYANVLLENNTTETITDSVSYVNKIINRMK